MKRKDIEAVLEQHPDAVFTGYPSHDARRRFVILSTRRDRLRPASVLTATVLFDGTVSTRKYPTALTQVASVIADSVEEYRTQRTAETQRDADYKAAHADRLTRWQKAWETVAYTAPPMPDRMTGWADESVEAVIIALDTYGRRPGPFTEIGDIDFTDLPA